jgi:Xaa-Pro aminopeptidase
MSYYNQKETENRLDRVRSLMKRKDLDAALVYYDELNIANGWYLTGWCPQFEKGAVLIPAKGEPMILGGPESQPFAKMNSAIKNTRNFSAFMVPDEEYPNATIIGFPDLFDELKQHIQISKVGIVGTDAMPYQVYSQLKKGFDGVNLVDITDDYTRLRYVKSDWEIENIKKSFSLSYQAYQEMKKAIAPDTYEYEVGAAGEYVCRRQGANGFAFSVIVGSGERSNAVVPTALNKKMQAGETVMVGIAPRINGYAGVVGDTLPVSGTYTESQKKCVNHLREVFRLTKKMLKPGVCGKEIDIPGRKYFEDHDLIDYLVCPFVHTVGLMEAEAPFFGPNGDEPLMPGMVVSIDVSFFGHPKWYGARIETGYLITETGYEPLCPEMDKILTENV